MAHQLLDDPVCARELAAGGGMADAPLLDAFELNGARQRLPADLSQRLIDYLRADLRQFGTKEGCRQGDCGSCTVLVDGEGSLWHRWRGAAS